MTEVEGVVLGDPLPAAGVEVRGIRIDANTVLATEIKAEDAETGRHRLRGGVDLNGVIGNTISILGVAVTVVEGNTDLEIEDLPYTGTLASFLAMIDDNGDPADGPNSAVDLRFDENTFVADQIEIELEDD